MTIKQQTTTTYDHIQYGNDDGLWTVRRISIVDIAKVYSNGAACDLIRQLKTADEKENTGK